MVSDYTQDLFLLFSSQEHMLILFTDLQWELLSCTCESASERWKIDKQKGESSVLQGPCPFLVYKGALK